MSGWPVNLITLVGRLRPTKRLTSTQRTFFWPITDNRPSLNQQKGNNDRRKYFMINKIKLWKQEVTSTVCEVVPKLRLLLEKGILFLQPDSPHFARETNFQDNYFPLYLFSLNMANVKHFFFFLYLLLFVPLNAFTTISSLNQMIRPVYIMKCSQVRVFDRDILHLILCNSCILLFRSRAFRFLRNHFQTISIVPISPALTLVKNLNISHT